MSALADRMAGISADKLMEMPEFKQLTLHHGLRAKDVVVQATRSAVKTDPREAWRGVSLGYSDRRGAPVLFIGINEKRDVDRRAWNPTRKKTRGARSVSPDTVKRNSYFGRSRGFVLRWLNSGTQQRLTKHRARWNKDHTSYRYKENEKSTATAANRGAIRGKRFFSKSAQRALIWISNDWLHDTAQLVERKFNR